jgi:hypothetical protein
MLRCRIMLSKGLYYRGTPLFKPRTGTRSLHLSGALQVRSFSTTLISNAYGPQLHEPDALRHWTRAYSKTYTRGGSKNLSHLRRLPDPTSQPQKCCPTTVVQARHIPRCDSGYIIPEKQNSPGFATNAVYCSPMQCCVVKNRKPSTSQRAACNHFGSIFGVPVETCFRHYPHNEFKAAVLLQDLAYVLKT